MYFDIDISVPDKNKSINDGAIKNILFGGLNSQIDAKAINSKKKVL